MLKTIYPALFHVTCLAHLLHNCTEKVHAHFKQVNNLIVHIKAKTVKNPSRRNMFAAISSPPQPVLTCWGSWINAAEYYAKKLPQVKELVNSFSSGGILVKEAKKAANKASLTVDLALIKQDYSALPKLIKNFESSKYNIWEAVVDINSLDLCEDTTDICAYLTKRMDKNLDLAAINDYPKGVSPAVYAMLQQCQPTSAVVERSFSMLYKMLARQKLYARKYRKVHCSVL